MAADDKMPKVDFVKDSPKIHQSTLDYIKKLEQKNLERVMELKRIRKRNIITGILLATGVFAIYGYSIFAVKQETFLDEIDDPKQNKDGAV